MCGNRIVRSQDALFFSPRFRFDFDFSLAQLTRMNIRSFSASRFFAQMSVGAIIDIDGVLIQGKQAIPGAREALLRLQSALIPREPLFLRSVSLFCCLFFFFHKRRFCDQWGRSAKR